MMAAATAYRVAYCGTKLAVPYSSTAHQTAFRVAYPIGGEHERVLDHVAADRGAFGVGNTVPALVRGASVAAHSLRRRTAREGLAASLVHVVSCALEMLPAVGAASTRQCCERRARVDDQVERGVIRMGRANADVGCKVAERVQVAVQPPTLCERRERAATPVRAVARGNEMELRDARVRSRTGEGGQHPCVRHYRSPVVSVGRRGDVP